jgi:hypothetical protein
LPTFFRPPTIAKYLQRSVWRERYGLSDSIFLVGKDTIEASAAAAEFFFNLAFYNATQDRPVLMRGAITLGEVHRTGPIFPETAKANLVGEAIVRAVELEKSGAKGPRLLVSAEIAAALRKSKLKSLVDRTTAGTNELLWLLSPDVHRAEGLDVGDIVAAAARLALNAGVNSAVREHYASYLDLAIRSLLKLKTALPEAADLALKKAQIRTLRVKLSRVVDSLPDHGPANRRLAELLG